MIKFTARKDTQSTSSLDPACRFVREEEALQGLDEKVQRKKDLKSRMSEAVKEWTEEGEAKFVPVVHRRLDYQNGK